MINKRRSQGFTIIETTIVMAFVALLALSVVFVSVYIGKMYAKGVTLKALNQVGRDVSDVMRRDVTASQPQRIKYVTTGGPNEFIGRLCLGEVSYVWNSAGLLRNPSAATPKMKTNTNKEVHLVRVIDSSARYCTPNATGVYPVQIAAGETYSEMLMNTDNELAIYSFVFTSLHSSSNPSAAPEGLYNIKFALGTNQTDTTLVAPDGTVTCKPPTDSSANFDFCSVRDFDLLIRAGGERG